jgi:hypothetical protein
MIENTTGIPHLKETSHGRGKPGIDKNSQFGTEHGYSAVLLGCD